MLFNVVLGFSALQLSRVSSFDAFVAEKYYTRCVELLIPMMSDERVAMDENVLATAVILRKYEEMNGQSKP